MRKILSKSLIYFIGTFILLRAVQLLTSFNRLFSPLEPRSAYLAEDIIRGKTTQLFDYLTYLETGGRLLVSTLAVPLYISLGGAAISVKLVEILIWSLSLGIWYLFCRKFFGKITAYFMALLFILAPPLMIRASLITSGAHNEMVFLIIVTFFIFFNMLFYKKNHHLVLFGLFSGLSFYLSSLFIVPFTCCIISWLILDKRFFLKRFLIFLPSFILGLSPVFWYMHKGIFEIGPKDSLLDASFNRGLDSISAFLYKFKETVSVHLPGSFSYDDFFFLKGEFLSAVYYFIFIISYFSICWINRRHIANIFRNLFAKQAIDVPGQSLKEFVFILYPVVFFLLFLISDRYIGCGSLAIGPYRYLVSLFPIMIMIISLALNRLMQVKPRWCFVTLIILCLIGGIGNIEYIDIHNLKKTILARTSRYKAANYGRSRGWLVVQKSLSDDLEAGLRQARSFKSAQERLSFYRGLGANISEKFAEDPDIWIKVINKFAELDEDFKDNCYGGFMADKEDNGFLIDIVDNYASWRRIIEKVEPEWRKYCYAALGLTIGTKNKDNKSRLNIEEYMRLINKCPLAYQKYCFQGFGKGIAEVYWDDLDKYSEIAKYIALEYLPDYYEGVGMALVERFGYDIKRIVNAINESIDPGYAPCCHKGVRTMFFSTFVFDEERKSDLIAELERRIRERASL